MVTQKILDAHLRLRHADAPEGGNGQPEVVAGVLNGVEITILSDVPAEITPTPVTPLAQQTDENFVILKSADNRKLELSIGGTTWNDLEIKVPKEMAITARRSLLEGGFFLKD